MCFLKFRYLFPKEKVQFGFVFHKAKFLSDRAAQVIIRLVGQSHI